MLGLCIWRRREEKSSVEVKTDAYVHPSLRAPGWLSSSEVGAHLRSPLRAPHDRRVYASYESSTTHPFLSLPFSHRLLIIASSCFICFISSTHHFGIPIIQRSALSPRFSSLSYLPCCIFLLLVHSPIAGFSVLLHIPGASIW